MSVDGGATTMTTTAAAATTKTNKKTHILVPVHAPPEALLLAAAQAAPRARHADLEALVAHGLVKLLHVLHAQRRLDLFLFVWIRCAQG